MFNQVPLEGTGQFSNFQSFGVFQLPTSFFFSLFSEGFSSILRQTNKTTQKRGVFEPPLGKVAQTLASIFLLKKTGAESNQHPIFPNHHHKNIQKSAYFMLPTSPYHPHTDPDPPWLVRKPKWLLLQVQVPHHWAAKELCEHAAPNETSPNHLAMEDLNQLSWHVSGQSIIKGSLAEKLPIYERHPSKVKKSRVKSSRGESRRVK